MISRIALKFCLLLTVIFFSCSLSKNFSSGIGYRLQLDALHTKATDFYLNEDYQSAIPAFEELVQADTTFIYPDDRVSLYKCYTALSKFHSADMLLKSTSVLLSKPNNSRLKENLSPELVQLLENINKAQARKAALNEGTKEKVPGDSTVVVPYDSPPQPKGGFSSIMMKLVYPEIARINQLEGIVIVYAHINQDGYVDQTKIRESLGGGCDEAAINAVKAVKWIPAMRDNKPIAVWVTVPLRFKLK